MVVAYGLSTTAGKLVNGKKGQVCGSLGETKEGRYPVVFKGEKGFKHIKPCNLRWISNRDAAAEGKERKVGQRLIPGNAGGEGGAGGRLGRAPRARARRPAQALGEVGSDEKHGKP